MSAPSAWSSAGSSGDRSRQERHIAAASSQRPRFCSRLAWIAATAGAPPAIPIAASFSAIDSRCRPSSQSMVASPRWNITCPGSSPIACRSDSIASGRRSCDARTWASVSWKTASPGDAWIARRAKNSACWCRPCFAATTAIALFAGPSAGRRLRSCVSVAAAWSSFPASTNWNTAWSGPATYGTSGARPPGGAG
jgi:hypothetical protein